MKSLLTLLWLGGLLSGQPLAQAATTTTTLFYPPAPALFSDSVTVSDTVATAAPGGYAGIGVGIPYGVVGLNLELCINPRQNHNLYLTAGVGHSVVDNLAYSAGLNVYLRPQDITWRPRLMLLYGTNAFLEEKTYYSTGSYTAYQGVTAGAGQLFHLGKSKRLAISLDVLVILTSGLFAEMDKRDQNGESYATQALFPATFSLGFKSVF